MAMLSFSAYPEDPRPRRAAEALLAEGMSVDFICLADDKSLQRETAGRLNVWRLRINHRRGGAFSYAFQYAAFILSCGVILAVRALKRPYDLVYVHNMPDILVLSALVPKALGAKLILDQHDPMPELMMTIFNLDGKSFAVRVIERLEKLSCGYADLVITVNIACKRLFADRSCPPQKIGVVMNAPDEKIFGVSSPNLGRAAEPARPFVIMYHGSILERNGLDLAVDAFARARETISSAQLRIYGRQTPFLERVMDKVRTRGLDRAVLYMGPRTLEQLVPEIGSCDLGIIPNHQSAFTEINTPTRIFEFLSCGKPVIAPRSAGICDYFDDRSLLLFKLGSSEDLARKIEYACSHPAELLEIVQRGQMVYRGHCWQIERKRLIELVAQLVCGGRGGLSNRIKAEADLEQVDRHFDDSIRGTAHPAS